MMALIKETDDFYLIDSHARDSSGMPDPNGTAVVMKFYNILELEQYLYCLSLGLNANLFEIVPVQFSMCKMPDQNNKCVKDREYQKMKRSVETDHDKQARLNKVNEYNKRKQSHETACEKQLRLQKANEYKKRKQSEETDSERKTRLQKEKESKMRKLSEETNSERKVRLEKENECKKRRRSEETDRERQIRLDKDRLSKKQKRAKPQHRINQEDYLNLFDISNNGRIGEQCWAKANINKFHKSMQYTVAQCTVCHEAWPMKSKPNSPYVCSRCFRDKKSPKKFSCENLMIPSYVPDELQNLTQVEEMLIARALPIMRVYVKPGGQRDGKGDPTNQGLLRDVPLQERIKHLLKFAENIDGKWVYRFANHPRFSYWAFNMIQRKRILQQSGIFLKQNPGEAHLTIDELREMAVNNNANVFMSKVSRYVGNIAGTNSYWNRVRDELKAIITNVGAPTLFFTFSSADMHWPELHALFNAGTDCQTGNSTSQVRRQNVINNPHLVDWFFTQRLESFVKHWLYEKLGAKWHWFRYEYQGRGSIHCHGTAKLNNDPGLRKLTQTALKGYLAKKFKDENDCSDTTELDQDIEAGQKAAETVIQYVDWLLSTVNPNPPDEDMWIRPEVHPCQRSHLDIPNHEKPSDYVDLLNMVQRHTRCSTSYCLRKKSNETELKCRFHFPFDNCPQTKLEFEKIHTSGDNEHYRAKIVTKRNDARLNNHQQLQLQGWRANCDIQVVIDHYACVEYFTKYAAKGEPRSPLLKQAFNSIMQNVDSNTDPRRAIKKVVMRSLGERDYAAQETMQSLKLHSSSFNVIPRAQNNGRSTDNDRPRMLVDRSLSYYAGHFDRPSFHVFRKN
ncbi:uncharacterized protein LOC114531038 isoform X1 [Dendronephthya gigantea]|uniref:uncharacterized protein LOC114531038 isoform X1 n=1 Tax=Dendronephthya gigantea TaxID=151771 RepID=UPI00106B8CE4|nr:uncharacterized protein LOC114531038 isoform X1 [Dendronephthya gigantea]